jgi:ATP-dependent RNA helicase DeaD
MAVVLDEADEMLDMGFAEDLELILEAAPDKDKRQTALFSATLPPRIAGIAERHLNNPVRVLIPRDAAKKGSVPKVRQTAYIVPRAHKVAALGRVLDLESPTLALVFCRTRIEVDELAERLTGRGYAVESLHGGMSQQERDRVMKKARANTVDLMVATDVAARGIDIEHISHVVNFDVPSSPEAYVHRIGRTGRAGREGVAITLAEPREHRLVRNIEWSTKQKIEIATVPTPLDVKARRLDITKGTLREAVIAGELDGFRSVVESLAGEYDLMDVAAAAVKLAHEAVVGPGKAEDEVQIPAYESFSRPEPRAPGPPRNDQPRSAFAGRGRFDDRAPQGAPRGTPAGAPPQAERPAVRPAADERAPGGAVRKGGAHKAVPGAAGGDFNARNMVRIYIGAGRKLGMRPADLVGAIANEAHVNARGIGDIEIADAFSLVELPESDADRVVAALRGATLRGRKVTVRRDDGRRKQ